MNFIDNFRAPSAEYRGKPFWAWNGKLEKEELLHQIDVIKEMGFGGFFMHSRTGLATEYLGEEWFELINVCADRAKELNMEAWLYDEDRWPSGTAGGMVTKNPENRMRSIEMSSVPSEKSDPFGCLAVFNVTMENDILIEYKRIRENSQEKANCGKERLQFSIVEMEKSDFYNGFTYVDTLNMDAVNCFIESTHEQYVENCGDRIGGSIMGVFTDEPHRGSLMSSFGQGTKSGENRIPFTAHLLEEFQKKYGYDLTDKLPEVFLKTNADGINLIKWQYVELVQEMFLDNYAKPIADWCREHNMLLTGHILHENSLTAQTAMSGSVMRYYEYMDNPGIDFLGEHDRCYWIAKQLQSVARQLNKKKLLSELYGCTGWQMGFENYKAVGDWQALYGINFRCPHLSWYTMEGQAKRDYPASILEQSAWWKEYAYVEDYYARIAAFTELGTPCCNVLVINPVESVWARVSVGWCDGLSAKDKRVAELEHNYENLFNWLQNSRIDFDYGDEDIMTRHGGTKNGKLFVGQSAYDTVIISGMDTIRGSTIALLKEFEHQGGRVIICGDPPIYVDCEKCNIDLAAVHIGFSEKELTSVLSSHAVKIVDCDGNNVREILCQMKENDSTKYIMLINNDRSNAVCNVVLEIKSEGIVTRFIPETGEVINYPFEREGEICRIPLTFEPIGEYLLSVGREFTADKNDQAVSTEHEMVLNGDFHYELDEKNICVLDFAAVSVDDGEYTEPLEILKADKYIRNIFKLPYRSGEMLQPWFVKQTEVIDISTVSLKFDFDIQKIPDSQVLLVMEKPEDFSIFINGNLLTYQPNDFRWADICYKSLIIPINYLHMGENTVELRIPYNMTTNLEAVFLFGNFGVKLNGSRRALAELPETLSLGDITSQGLPFYSGELSYICKIPKIEADHMLLKLEGFAGACVKVNGNNKQSILAFKPYETDISDLVEEGIVKVTVVLTRRNTFGPLHQIPAVSSSCGPESFVTEGESFSTNYSIIESGLTCPIKILY